MGSFLFDSKKILIVRQFEIVYNIISVLCQTSIIRVLIYLNFLVFTAH